MNEDGSSGAYGLEAPRLASDILRRKASPATAACRWRQRRSLHFPLPSLWRRWRTFSRRHFSALALRGAGAAASRRRRFARGFSPALCCAVEGATPALRDLRLQQAVRHKGRATWTHAVTSIPALYYCWLAWRAGTAAGRSRRFLSSYPLRWLCVLLPRAARRWRPSANCCPATTPLKEETRRTATKVRHAAWRQYRNRGRGEKRCLAGRTVTAAISSCGVYLPRGRSGVAVGDAIWKDASRYRCMPSIHLPLLLGDVLQLEVCCSGGLLPSPFTGCYYLLYLTVATCFFLFIHGLRQICMKAIATCL